MRGIKIIFGKKSGGLGLAISLITLGLCLGIFQTVAKANGTRDAFDTESIDKVYAEFGQNTIWWEPETGLTLRGNVLISILSQSDQEGLRPSDYLPSTDFMNELSGSEAERQNYDRNLTKGLLRYIAEVRDGRLSARYVDPELSEIPTPTDATDFLMTGLRKADFGAWMKGLPPQIQDYQRLKKYLERYRDLTGLEWPRLNTEKSLDLGSIDPIIPKIRKRLKVLGDFPADGNETNDIFDEDFLAAIRRFQARNGLATDGVIGPVTYAALNVSPKSIVTKIIINLERMRQLPKMIGSRYIMVNIPRFELTAISDGAVRLRMPVIVGQKSRPTPILNDKMTSIIFRPTWTVPVKVAREDLLPKIKTDVNYLATLDFKVLASWREGASELDPQAVDWRAISPERLPYKFVQASGPNNALGLIRFTLTNPYDIYLHDTPNKKLFAKADRAISSGCVRVPDVAALTSFVMEPSSEWTPANIYKAMNGNVRKIVKLPTPMPIHMTYLTAIVNETGELNLSKDIYGRDADLIRILGLDPIN